MNEAQPKESDQSEGPGLQDPLEPVQFLLTAEAVHARCATVFSRIEEGHSERFAFHPDKLPVLAEKVAELTRSRFPALRVPLHSRWRHFEVGGTDRFASLAAARRWPTAAETARAMGDLAIVSVLLDAGAGPRWRYAEAATGVTMGRSEGLALASLAMFAGGAFSGVPADPLRADASGLESVTMEEFRSAFQVSKDNPLEGTDGRLGLLHALAAGLRAAPDLFALEDDPRPGGLIDALAAEAKDDTLPAATILSFVLEGLSPVWPSRHSLEGIPLGDAWPFPPLGNDDTAECFVPFHKLSTWLALSLIEPLQARGIEVVELDTLPGLAEYRNGGLFIDGGALSTRDPEAHTEAYSADDPMIVEWRAATIALLTRLAPLIREKLEASADQLPLAAILEGGTWLCGRQMAYEKRPDGSPPLTLKSDGTVF